MKKYIYIIYIIVLLLLTLSACDDCPQEGEFAPAGMELHFNLLADEKEKGITLPFECTEYSMNIYSYDYQKLGKYVVENTGDWCKLEAKDDGTGIQLYLIANDVNLTGRPRTTEIKVYSEKSPEYFVKAKVTQETLDLAEFRKNFFYTSIDPVTGIELPFNMDGTYRIDIKSYITAGLGEFAVESSANWCTATPRYRDGQLDYLLVEAYSNSTPSPRTAELKIYSVKYPHYFVTLKVTQHNLDLAEFRKNLFTSSIDPQNGVVLPYNGGSVPNIYFNKNVTRGLGKFAVESSANWCSGSVQDDINGTACYIFVSANETNATERPRTAELKIYSEKYPEYFVTLKVTQQYLDLAEFRNNFFTTSIDPQNGVVLPYDGGSKYLGINENVIPGLGIFAVESSANWCTATPYHSAYGYIYALLVKANGTNSTGSPRTAELKIYSEIFPHYFVILKVTQNAAP